MLSDAQLQRMMPNLAPAKRALYLPHLNRAMQAYAVDTLLRIAAFVAQLAHESGEFRWMEEIWGPTAAQRRYEPPGDLAKRLGNTQPGDGRRFKGRGPIQITGRYNYAKFGELLGVELSTNPALAATPEVAFATAGLYWQSNGLNELADARQFVAITRRINGGTNGLADRQKYYERAQTVLGVAAAAPRGKGAPTPLSRGFEAIRATRSVKPRTKKAAVAKAAPTKLRARKAAPKKTAPKKTAAKRSPAGNTASMKRATAKRAVR